ncbi:MAG: acetate kinase [Pseudomonadota bacterium]
MSNATTNKNILVINTGSSSVKFSLFDKALEEKASGLAENLGTSDAQLKWRDSQSTTHHQVLQDTSHQGAILTLLAALREQQLLEQNVSAIGHRVVHGGEFFSGSVRITPEVTEKIKACNHLAPLHNPANLLGIEILTEQFPEAVQIAVFDTAFHQSLPDYAYTYALPIKYYQSFGIRRYGFHGTSHRYVTQAAADHLQRPLKDLEFISAHLGNGCSATAVSGGISRDTTMGLTPLEGLVMGTRCGDIDPSLHQFLAEKLNTNLAEITRIFNQESGLKGLSGLSNDMRTLCEAEAKGHQDAALAIEVFCYRLAKSIAALAVPLKRLDALIFTGGIGENAASIRSRVIQHLSIFQFSLDEDKNNAIFGGAQGLITTGADDKPQALVIATREEWMIAKDVCELMAQQ